MAEGAAADAGDPPQAEGADDGGQKVAGQGGETSGGKPGIFNYCSVHPPPPRPAPPCVSVCLPASKCSIALEAVLSRASFFQPAARSVSRASQTECAPDNGSKEGIRVRFL